MGDEKDPSASSSQDVAPSVSPSASVAPRPVSVVPRPTGTVGLMSRMPPPPSARGGLPGQAPGAFRSAPPPPPQRSVPTAPPPSSGSPSTSAPASVAPVVASVAASPSVVPRAPATPPPPPQRHSIPPSFSRPPTQPPVSSVSAQLEQRLGAAQLELRKLGSERHTLRARLRREADRVQELASALRAEKELRHQASDEHQAALAGLRARLAELERETAAELQTLREQLAEARCASVGAPALAEPARAGKSAPGLRRIRGIGPAYQRALEALGITRVQQIAHWTESDLSAFADQLKIRAERIIKDDWIGQARSLEPDPEG